MAKFCMRANYKLLKFFSFNFLFFLGMHQFSVGKVSTILKLGVNETHHALFKPLHKLLQ